MSPGFLYVSESFQAVLRPCIPPPIITTLALEGNVVITKHYFLAGAINIIFYRTKNYI